MIHRVFRYANDNHLLLLLICTSLSNACYIDNYYKCRICDSKLKENGILLNKASWSKSNFECNQVEQIKQTTKTCNGYCYINIEFYYNLPNYPLAHGAMYTEIHLKRSCSNEKLQIPTSKYSCKINTRSENAHFNCIWPCIGNYCNSPTVYKHFISNNGNNFFPICKECIRIISNNKSNIYDTCTKSKVEPCFDMCYYLRHVTIYGKIIDRMGCMREKKENMANLINIKINKINKINDLRIYRNGIWNYGLCRPRYRYTCNNNFIFKKHFTYQNVIEYQSSSIIKRNVCIICKTFISKRDECTNGLPRTMFNVEICKAKCLTVFTSFNESETIFRACESNKLHFDKAGIDVQFLDKEINTCHECSYVYKKTNAHFKYSIKQKVKDLIDCKITCNKLGIACVAYTFIKINQTCLFSGKLKERIDDDLHINATVYTKILTKNCIKLCYRLCNSSNIACNNRTIDDLLDFWTTGKLKSTHMPRMQNALANSERKFVKSDHMSSGIYMPYRGDTMQNSIEINGYEKYSRLSDTKINKHARDNRNTIKMHKKLALSCVNKCDPHRYYNDPAKTRFIPAFKNNSNIFRMDKLNYAHNPFDVNFMSNILTFHTSHADVLESYGPIEQTQILLDRVKKKNGTDYEKEVKGKDYIDGSSVKEKFEKMYKSEMYTIDETEYEPNTVMLKRKKRRITMKINQNEDTVDSMYNPFDDMDSEEESNEDTEHKENSEIPEFSNNPFDIMKENSENPVFSNNPFDNMVDAESEENIILNDDSIKEDTKTNMYKSMDEITLPTNEKTDPTRLNAMMPTYNEDAVKLDSSARLTIQDTKDNKKNILKNKYGNMLSNKWKQINEKTLKTHTWSKRKKIAVPAILATVLGITAGGIPLYFVFRDKPKISKIEYTDRKLENKKVEIPKDVFVNKIETKNKATTEENTVTQGDEDEDEEVIDTEYSNDNDLTENSTIDLEPNKNNINNTSDDENNMNLIKIGSAIFVAIIILFLLFKNVKKVTKTKSKHQKNIPFSKRKSIPRSKNDYFL